MTDLYVSVSDTDEIRQGDIIRKFGDPDTAPQWGVVLTADCDIAQRKAGDRYTWLEIIAMHDYIEQYWADEQLKKIVEKQTRAATEAINGHIRRLPINGLSSLTSASLHTWLTTTQPTELLKLVTQKRDEKTEVCLRALRVGLGIEQFPTRLSQLRAAWDILGQDSQKQQDAIKGALSAGSAFQDFFVLPELPATRTVGFVVLLRAISALHVGDLYLTELDARINGQSNAFHRIGRLNDRVKFAIAQKVAFLFSRIGLLKPFEESCDLASSIFANDVFNLNPGSSNHGR